MQQEIIDDASNDDDADDDNHKGAVQALVNNTTSAAILGGAQYAFLCLCLMVWSEHALTVTAEANHGCEVPVLREMVLGRKSANVSGCRTDII